MSQILAGAGPYALTYTWYVDGTATDVGDVTIGVVDGNGDELVAALTATTNNADGTYSYSLADIPDVDSIALTWTRTDTGASLVNYREVVGAWLFTEAQARAFDAAALTNTSTYTDKLIVDERARIVEEFEQWTGRSWVPRYCRMVLSGTSGRRLSLADGHARTSDGTPADIRDDRPSRNRVSGSSIAAPNTPCIRPCACCIRNRSSSMALRAAR